MTKDEVCMRCRAYFIELTGDDSEKDMALGKIG